jgi:SAM-dependent methyltransferase
MSDPSRWLTTHRHLLPASGDALDLACGSGRNALWLAEQGYRTLGVDRNATVLGGLNAEAALRRLSLRTHLVDLEEGEPFLEPDTFDLIVVVHYLHRPLFPKLVHALRPRGVLVYETFTRAQAVRGKPTNPAFLLEPGELVTLVRPLEILASREGDFEEKMLASVVAVRLPSMSTDVPIWP